MSSNRRLGLHSSRYPQRHGEYGLMTKADTIGLDGEFIDIACLDTGKVWVNCWPAPDVDDEEILSEDIVKQHRRWGKHGSTPAVIVPFRMSAGHDDDYKIRNFQIDLVFGSSTVDSLTSRALTGQGRELSASSICLLDMPRPQRLVGRGEKRNPEPSLIPWKLCSRSVTDPTTGKSRTARWTWTSNNNDPELIHGVVVVGHLGERIYIGCKVHGQAYRGRTAFRFSNVGHSSRFWHLDPKVTEEDLGSRIAGLESLMLKINMGDLALESDVVNQREHTGAASVDETRARVYGPMSAGGTSQVHQGDTIINCFYSLFGWGSHTASEG